MDAFAPSRQTLDPLVPALDDSDPSPPTLADALAEMFAELDASQPWRRRAACQGVPVATFLHDGGPKKAHATALELCQSCPVRGPCLREALRYERDELGNRPEPCIRGGLAPMERQELLGDPVGGSRRAVVDTCKRGHPLSGDNLYVSPSNGHRACKRCRRERMRARRERQRESA